jgi:hypothetical protein
VKELDRITPEYAAFIDASPFVALATSGPEGLDCSPRGDLAGFVSIHDEKTLMMPDRRGNNRADSLKNIIRDPRVGLLFLVPGSGTTLRVNGRAEISIDPELCASFTVEGRAPRSVNGDRGRFGLFPVRSGHPPLRTLEPGKARRPEKPANSGANPCGDESPVDRRRRL